MELRLPPDSELAPGAAVLLPRLPHSSKGAATLGDGCLGFQVNGCFLSFLFTCLGLKGLGIKCIERLGAM